MGMVGQRGWRMARLRTEDGGTTGMEDGET